MGGSGAMSTSDCEDVVDTQGNRDFNQNSNRKVVRNIVCENDRRRLEGPLTSHPGCPVPKHSVGDELKHLKNKVDKDVDLLTDKKINLREMNLGDGDATAVAMIICHGKVEELNLSYNKFTSDGAEVIGKAVAYS